MVLKEIFPEYTMVHVIFTTFVLNNSMFFLLIFTIDSYNKACTKSEDGAEDHGTNRFMSISTRYN